MGILTLEVTPATLFDLASLTKPVATTTMATILYERGLLELDAPVIGVIPEFLADSCGEPDPRRREVTFRMLLAHSSGLPAYEKLFLKAHSREDLLRAAFTTPLSADPGTRAEYSDIGFIILGAALERLAGESLDVFCQREIFGPLAMTNTTFNPPAELATSRRRKNPDRHRRRTQHLPHTEIIQGEVQDENACVLGGVAGHAGLFSTAEDLARFAHAMLHGGQPHPPPRNRRPLHPPRIRARRHIPRPRLGHSLRPLAIRKIFRPALLRPPRLHRHLALDRSRPPTLHHPPHQPHLARLLESSHQARSARRFHDAVIEALHSDEVTRTNSATILRSAPFLAALLCARSGRFCVQDAPGSGENDST